MQRIVAVGSLFYSLDLIPCREEDESDNCHNGDDLDWSQAGHEC